MAVERRTVWLGLALLVVIVVGGVLYSSRPASRPASTGNPTRKPVAAGVQAGRNTKKTDEQTETAPGHVNLAALKDERGEPADLGRNPFRFRPPPAPPPPPTPTPAKGPANQGPVVAMGPPVPAGPPPPPPIPLKFIGLVTKVDGTRIAVLSDGRSPQPGKEGDIILGQYRILRIGLESLDIAYVDGRGRTTLRLTGQ
jgi:hypothetical protein